MSKRWNRNAPAQTPMGEVRTLAKASGERWLLHSPSLRHLPTSRLSPPPLSEAPTKKGGMEGKQMIPAWKLRVLLARMPWTRPPCESARWKALRHRSLSGLCSDPPTFPPPFTPSAGTQSTTTLFEAKNKTSWLPPPAGRHPVPFRSLLFDSPPLT